MNKGKTIVAASSIGPGKRKETKENKVQLRCLNNQITRYVASSSGRKLCSVMSGGWYMCSCHACYACICVYVWAHIFFFFPQGPKEPPIGVLGERKENIRMCACVHEERRVRPTVRAGPSEVDSSSGRKLLYAYIRIPSVKVYNLNLLI